MAGMDDFWGSLTRRAGRPLIAMLTEDGEPGSLCDIIADYSAAPKDFWVGAPQGVVYEVVGVTLCLTVENARDKNYYGEVNGGLTNGVQFVFKRGTEETILNPHGSVKSNRDLVVAGWRSYNTEFNGNQDLFTFDFRFRDRFGVPLFLYGDAEDKFIVRVQDNFTSQDTHCFSISGIRHAVREN